MKNLILLSLAASSVALALAGCELNDPCDPGQDFKYGLCIPQDTDQELGGGGEPGCEQALGGAENAGECLEPPNAGDACTEGGDECVGGTVCGAPRLPSCIALCGPDDPFEDGCPDGLACTDLGEAIICF